MRYRMRFISGYFSVGFWLDEDRWIESSNWFRADRAQEEVDRLNRNVQTFRLGGAHPEESRGF